jgi:hypothetical protein
LTKIDLGLINADGHGRPVPKELDRQIIKYIIGQRKKDIQADPSLFQTYRWDHSDVFYASRTHLNQHNWDTSVYNDNTAGGSNRRKELYDMIRPICEDFYHVKRHQIGIYPEDRAIMAYNGVMYAASFDNLKHLMYSGTDVIAVEKQGTVIKMTPFTRNTGVAFIQSQGFISEYGIALARLANHDSDAAEDYLGRLPPVFRGNVGSLTDCDSSGVVIGMKVKGATRIGIDPNTIDEINEVNEGKEWELGIELPIELEDLEEGNHANTHWQGLKGIILGTGKLYESLTWQERGSYREYLMTRPETLGGNIRLIEYLKDNRIELNTILAAVKPQAFWNWLKWKMLQVWPTRDYRRGGLMLADSIHTPTLNRFIEYYEEKTGSVSKSSIKEAREEISKVKGLYDDIEGFNDSVPIIKRVIQGDILNGIILQNEEIQKIDLALEKIMKNGNDKSKSKDNSKEEELDEADEHDDGNEWND